MKNKVSLILVAATFLAPHAFAEDNKYFIGTVDVITSIAKIANPNGTLYIFAKKVGEDPAFPQAVVKIKNPKYPQSFVLKSENTMVPGAASHPFVGYYHLYARHSDTGLPMKVDGYMGKASGFSCEGVRTEDGPVSIAIDTVLN